MEAKDTLRLTSFPVVVETDCKNIYRIYPLQQEKAAKIYEIASTYREVRKLYIFGSSVTGRCNIESDLDICIDADVSDGLKIYNLQKEIGDACDWNCDILIYSNLGHRLRNIIDREGVIIYEQSACSGTGGYRYCQAVDQSDR